MRKLNVINTTLCPQLQIHIISV